MSCVHHTLPEENISGNSNRWELWSRNTLVMFAPYIGKRVWIMIDLKCEQISLSWKAVKVCCSFRNIMAKSDFWLFWQLLSIAKAAVTCTYFIFFDSRETVRMEWKETRFMLYRNRKVNQWWKVLMVCHMCHYMLSTPLGPYIMGYIAIVYLAIGISWWFLKVKLVETTHKKIPYASWVRWWMYNQDSND